MTAPRTTLDVLIAARELIKEPSAWTNGYFARTDDGEPVEAERREAVCWCALGAIRRVTRRERLVERADIALENVLPRGHRHVDLYNDAPRRTHAQILALFDRAIAAERAR